MTNLFVSKREQEVILKSVFLRIKGKLTFSLRVKEI